MNILIDYLLAAFAVTPAFAGACLAVTLALELFGHVFSPAR